MRCARHCAPCSTSLCRRYAPPAASRSKAAVSARHAGRSFPSFPGPIAERLGIPFVYDPGPGILSMAAVADPSAYHRARAAVRFDEISRALVHALKYADRLDLAPMMGRWIAHAGRELLAEADALVPVPLHWRRLWARRFNQSAMLAAAISRETGLPLARSSA